MWPSAPQGPLVGAPGHHDGELGSRNITVNVVAPGYVTGHVVNVSGGLYI